MAAAGVAVAGWGLFRAGAGQFPHLGYLRVWGKLTAGLAGLDLPRPSEKALRDLRRRIGPAPLRHLGSCTVILSWPSVPGGVPADRLPYPSRRFYRESALLQAKAC